MTELIPKAPLFKLPTWLVFSWVAIALHISIFVSVKAPNPIEFKVENIEKTVKIGIAKLIPPPPKPISVQKKTVIQKKATPPKPKVKPKPKEAPKPIIKPYVVEKLPEPIFDFEETRKNDDIEIVEESIQIVENVEIKTSNNSLNQIADYAKAKLEDSYKATLILWLQRYKRYPNAAQRRGQEGVVNVEFTINADGEVLSFRVIETSEYERLNRAAIQMVQRASPLPPVPDDLRNGQNLFIYSVPLNFTIEKP